MTPSKLAACPSEQVLIDYLQNRLDERDRFQLEEHLLDCPMCAVTMESLEKYGPPAQGELNKLQKEVLAATIGAVEPSTTAAKPEAVLRRQSNSVLNSTFSTIRPFLAVAASVVLLLGLFGWYWSQTLEQRLFAQHFDPLPRYGYVSVRSLGGSASQELLANALNAQSKGDYALSISSWQAYLESEIDNLDFRPHLYIALAQLELGRLEEARFHLDQLPPDNRSEISEEANWYKALLDLREEKVASARERLESLTESGRTVYASKAQDVLEALRQ